MSKFLSCLALALALVQPAHAQTAEAPLTVVHAGHLIDGIARTERGHVSVLIRKDRIVDVVDGFVTPPGARVIDLSSKTVLPGLIDTHVHLLIQLGNGPMALHMVRSTGYDDLLDGVRNARLTLEAGFTTVRDLGGNTPAIIALKKGVAAGRIEGPRMLVAGGPLGPTGGHSDESTGFDPVLSKPEWIDNIIDSPEQAIHTVRSRYRDGADVIKIMPSGGVASVGDDPQAQLMTDAEIAAVVNTAHTLHMKVGAHAHGTMAILHATQLGVDSIEHGTYGNDETDRLMKAHGTYLVPTLIAGEAVYDYARLHPEALDPSSAAKALAVAPLMAANLQRAYKAGVKIAFGTDAGVFQHGRNAHEFELMVKAGMAPMDVIFSATRDAADLLGRSNDIGSVKAGGLADLVAVEGDPLADIGTLTHVGFVMQGGKVIKD